MFRGGLAEDNKIFFPIYIPPNTPPLFLMCLTYLYVENKPYKNRLISLTLKILTKLSQGKVSILLINYIFWEPSYKITQNVYILVHSCTH